jgi:cytochrome c oxidase subunit II
LWFEGLGFPIGPAARLPTKRPSWTLRPGGAPVACGVRRGGHDGLIEGAATTMLVFKRLTAVAVAIFALLSAIAVVQAAEAGHPSNWQLGLQESVTPVMDKIVEFHTWLVWTITAIAGFVLLLLIIIVVRFNARANPTPTRTTHNTWLEVAWTALPVIILVAIAIPSFRLLREQLVLPQQDVTVKVTGYAWYWGYEYPGNEGAFKFDSTMLDEASLKPGQQRLLAVDNEMVVPVNKTVRVQTTGAEVIHAFAVPSFGIKIDAIPGRLNETWFKATREGVYYGQCSELCGKDHAFMPIAVRVVSEQAFATWVGEAKQKFARDDNSPTNVAAATQSASQ